MESWEKDLENEIADKPHIVVVKQKNNNHSLLYFVITMLLLSLAFTFTYKKFQKVRFWVQDHFKIDNIKNISNTNDNTILDKLKKIEDDLKKNSDRIKVLGISQNENFAILQHEKSSRNFIMLNHNWSLNRKPEYLTIDPEDEKFIENNVDNQ